MKFLSILVFLISVNLWAQEKGVWTDPETAGELADYQIQGEYANDSYGAQVIALGEKSYCAVILPGGLPGNGWDEKNKTIMNGVQQGQTVTFTSPKKGPKKYYSPKPELFTPVKKFPPMGHTQGSGQINENTFTITLKGESHELKKVHRSSPSMGKKAPEGAVILFDGSNIDSFTKGRIDPKTKSLHTDAKDLYTKENFNNYHLHIEFMTPYMPSYRGAKRGNSGIYNVWDYELQVLDTFGLEGIHSECGGIYKTAPPRINMCYPPLTWQTYDIDFTNSVFKDGNKVKSAFITVKHNGVLIHDNTEIPAKTGGHRKTPEGQPGPFRLQGHGNKIQYRNIWLIKK